MVRRTVRKAFTLVEILIVVVILGILAAIVVPQFTNATQDAQGGNLQAQLSSLQRQIELYMARNNGVDPFASAADFTALMSGGYIKNPPRNPAFPASAGQPDTISVVTGATFGSATTAWVWNSDDRAIYASYFQEADVAAYSASASRGKVTTTAAD